MADVQAIVENLKSTIGDLAVQVAVLTAELAEAQKEVNGYRAQEMSQVEVNPAPETT
jgi:hypothetical protein